MEDTSYTTNFSKAIMSGLFAGIIITLASLVFYLGYKDSTGLPFSIIINVSSLIFVTNLLFLVIGIIYYAFQQLFRKADLVYIPVFLLLTVFFVWKASIVERSDNALWNLEFHHLLMGLFLMMGLAAAVGVPLLYHSRKFQENVL